MVGTIYAQSGLFTDTFQDLSDKWAMVPSKVPLDTLSD